MSSKVSIMVERPLVPLVMAFVDSLAGRVVVNDDGSLHTQEVAPISRSVPRRNGVFRLRGAMWELSLQGPDCFVPRSKGLLYIHCLIRAGGEEIPALRLAAGEEGFEQLRVQRRQQLVDATTMRQLEGTDVTGLLSEFRHSSQGLGGRPRTFVDEADRARSAVQKAISFAIKKLVHDSPDLAYHLKQSIFTGHRCLYRPAVPVHWKL